MAEQKTRIFVKKGPKGEDLSRNVTTPQSEVEALFDGFTEKTSTRTSTSSSSGAGSKPAGSSS